MFTNLSKYTYNITLPSSITRDVLEWFEIMESNNKLADALIELVHESIKSGKSIKVAEYLTGAHAEIQPSQARHEANSSGLFENLYNWQDSNNAIFKEDNEVKKEKKRMLSI